MNCEVMALYVQRCKSWNRKCKMCERIGFDGKVLVGPELKGWLLWEAARSPPISYGVNDSCLQAESIIYSSSMSVIMYLRRGSTSAIISWKTGGRTSEKDNSVDTKVSEERGAEGATDARAEIHLQPVVQTMVRQVVLLQPIEFSMTEHLCVLKLPCFPHLLCFAGCWRWHTAQKCHLMRCCMAKYH